MRTLWCFIMTAHEIWTAIMKSSQESREVRISPTLWSKTSRPQQSQFYIYLRLISKSPETWDLWQLRTQARERFVMQMERETFIQITGSVYEERFCKNYGCGLFLLKLALFRKDTLREEKDRVISVSLPLAPVGWGNRWRCSVQVRQWWSEGHRGGVPHGTDWASPPPTLSCLLSLDPYYVTGKKKRETKRD